MLAGAALLLALSACSETVGGPADTAPTSELSSVEASEMTESPSELTDSDVAEDLYWREYPDEIERFLVEAIPRVAMSNNHLVLSTVGCDDLRLDELALRWKAQSPASLSRAALELNYGPSVLWTLDEDADLIELLHREAKAFGKHCDNVMAASVRHREVLEGIFASSSSKPASEWQAAIRAAVLGLSALIDESRRTYATESQPLFQFFLRMLACHVAESYPDQPNEDWQILDKLYLEWESYLRNAYAIWHFAETAFYGRAPAMTPEAAKSNWVEENWRSQENFEAWLCFA